MLSVLGLPETLIEGGSRYHVLTRFETLEALLPEEIPETIILSALANRTRRADRSPTRCKYTEDAD
jgi:hypothetical protein